MSETETWKTDAELAKEREEEAAQESKKPKRPAKDEPADEGDK